MKLGSRRYHRRFALLSLLAFWGGAAFARDDRPAGMLWHDSYTLDYHRGVQASPLDGRPSVAITNNKDMDIAVWPDGRQVAATRYDARDRTTTFVVMNPATGKAVYSGTLDGHVSDLSPSPTDRRLAKARLSETSLTAFEEHVLDLATLKSRYRIADDDHFSWMPDGRFMLISIKTGRMRIASLDGGPETLVGRLDIPPERRMGEFAISPTGREFIMKLPLRNAVPKEADLWIGSIDGSRFEQLTQARAIGSALWSPDGRYVAYTVDTGHFCGIGAGGGYCVGSCDQWYTPVGLRKVRGFKGTPGAEAFQVSNRSGQPHELNCHVLAWTP
ncbi:hypothetical protein ACS5PN_13075 [Roseateles sp. NT4]|uniref:hypothetical protein n=1 Tax=Roseateles sp. NT4 TaxID=3453715 RepID=UPI003EEE117C